MADNRFSWTCRRVFPRPQCSAEKRRSGEVEQRRDHRAFRGKSRAAQRCSSGSQRSRSSCIFAPLSIVLALLLLLTVAAMIWTFVQLARGSGRRILTAGAGSTKAEAVRQAFRGAVHG